MDIKVDVSGGEIPKPTAKKADRTDAKRKCF
jgi:hypothetical protein